MSAADARGPSGAVTTRSSVARVVLALWVSVCALSLLLIALTIAFHLVSRYERYFADSFQPWRVQTVQALGVLGAPILGALIVWRQPANRYGWVWCLLGLAAAVRGAALAYELWAWYVAPYQPGGFEAAWLGSVTDTLYFGLVPLVLLLFPDGRPPSPRWRPVVWATVGVAVVWTLATAVAPGPMVAEGTPNLIVSLYGTPAELASRLVSELEPAVRLLIAVSGLSLLARLRHARGRQRQQVKWLTYVGVLIAAALVVQLKWHSMGLVRAVYLAVIAWAVYLAIGIAILRYRLYDIDRLINRTLVYGLLTALLALVYAGGVFVLGPLLNPAGRESALAVAASTLAVAALFQPLRRRVQTAVDRRFNRRRYNAAKTVEAFSTRLREHIELDALSTDSQGRIGAGPPPTGRWTHERGARPSHLHLRLHRHPVGTDRCPSPGRPPPRLRQPLRSAAGDAAQRPTAALPPEPLPPLAEHAYPHRRPLPTLPGLREDPRHPRRRAATVSIAVVECHTLGSGTFQPSRPPHRLPAPNGR
jgi:hypothetical protein